jgi:hypothetical protein
VSRAVPQPVLQPDGGNRAAEEKGIGLELRPVPGREEQSVGLPAQQVVDAENDRERQPLEDDAADPAEEIGRREREQAEDDPDQETITSDRYALTPEVAAQGSGVGDGCEPAHQARRKQHVRHAPRLLVGACRGPARQAERSASVG